MGEAGFDHGAQYFTVRDSGFREQVLAWRELGLVAEWPAPGPGCWVGTPAMNAPVKHLAQDADVTWGARVDSMSGSAGSWALQGEAVPADTFEAVLLAVPSENAMPLLDDIAPAMASRARQTPASPCWTVMAAFDAGVDFAADVAREDGAIGWAARNSSKPGRTGPEAWVIQAGTAWSVTHLEDSPGEVVPALLAAFAQRVGTILPGVLSATAHRWRYAKSGNSGDVALWDSNLGLGACGDWLAGPRVESAWMSGVRLARLVGYSIAVAR